MGKGRANGNAGLAQENAAATQGLAAAQQTSRLIAEMREANAEARELLADFKQSAREAREGLRAEREAAERVLRELHDAMEAPAFQALIASHVERVAEIINAKLDQRVAVAEDEIRSRLTALIAPMLSPDELANLAGVRIIRHRI